MTHSRSESKYEPHPEYTGERTPTLTPEDEMLYTHDVTPNGSEFIASANTIYLKIFDTSKVDKKIEAAEPAKISKVRPRSAGQ